MQEVDLVDGGQRRRVGFGEHPHANVDHLQICTANKICYAVWPAMALATQDCISSNKPQHFRIFLVYSRDYCLPWPQMIFTQLCSLYT